MAILISYIFALIFMACIAFTDYAKTIIIIGVPLTIAWAITLLGGVFYPLYRKHLFERSPIANQRMFGLPTMSVICFGTDWRRFFRLSYNGFCRTLTT